MGGRTIIKKSPEPVKNEWPEVKNATWHAKLLGHRVIDLRLKQCRLRADRGAAAGPDQTKPSRSDRDEARCRRESEAVPRTGAVAQFERDLIIERTKAGLAMARKNGRRLGPPIKWQPDMVKQARKLMKAGELTSQEVANVLKVSRRTLFRGLRAARDHDEIASA